MTGSLRLVLAVLAICGSTSLALAAASSTPTDYTPDPALKNASMTELQRRVANACVVVQTKDQLTSDASVTRKCGCYASQTMKTMTDDEISAYRETGVFNNSARSKALSSLDTCGLPRPF